MPKRLFVIACLATLLAAGSTASSFASAETTSSAQATTPGGASTAQSSDEASDLDTVVAASLDDIQSWWSGQLPGVYGKDYQPIPDDRVYAYSASNPPPACGGRGTTPYEQVAGNAFYCSEADFIAWDEQELFPRLDEKFGGFAIALVLAHELGHAVQARTHTSLNATVYLETQADCFAGAWAQHVEEDDPSLPIGDTDLDIALGGFL